MTPRVKWLGLGGLFLIWLLLIYVYVIDVPPAQEVPLKFTSGQAGGNRGNNGQTSVEAWDVKSLRAPARDLPATPKKNIFAAAAPPISPEAAAQVAARKAQRKAAAMAVAAAPALPPPPSPEELAKQQEELAAAAARQQAELAAQAARQQEELRRKQVQEHMGQYRYLGYVNQQGEQKAFLAKGREIYIIRQGEMLEGKFVVASVDAAAVKLRDSSSEIETVLKLKKEETASST
jgi:type IV secretory pathway VirB10-like protein